MIRAVARRLIPSSQRVQLRRFLDDVPFRLSDARTDLGERFRPGGALPIPPAGLRLRVGRNSSREEFLTIGRSCSEDLLTALEGSRTPQRAYPRWLDFGCGCGRVARHLLEHPEVEHLTGVDVDAKQIQWAHKHLPGHWQAIAPHPPTPLETASFDVIYAVSVFTHLNEEQQLQWLKELRRLLAPGGLLITSTHSPSLADEAFPLCTDQKQTLADTGFLFVPSDGPFNEQATFHSRAYLESVWTQFYAARQFFPFGLSQFQDLSVWSSETPG